jgi:hypothetical protein
MKLQKNTHIILLIEFAILLSLPLLPDSVLLSLDNIAVRAALLLALLLSALGGPYVLLLTFVIVMCLFVMRNQIKMHFTNYVPLLQQEQTLSNLEDTFKPLVYDVANANDQIPVLEKFEFSPMKDTGSNEFSPVDVSINQKIVQRSPAPNGVLDSKNF